MASSSSVRSWNASAAAFCSLFHIDSVGQTDRPNRPSVELSTLVQKLEMLMQRDACAKLRRADRAAAIGAVPDVNVAHLSESAPSISSASIEADVRDIAFFARLYKQCDKRSTLFVDSSAVRDLVDVHKHAGDVVDAVYSNWTRYTFGASTPHELPIGSGEWKVANQYHRAVMFSLRSDGHHSLLAVFPMDSDSRLSPDGASSSTASSRAAAQNVYLFDSLNGFHGGYAERVVSALVKGGVLQDGAVLRVVDPRWIGRQPADSALCGYYAMAYVDAIVDHAQLSRQAPSPAYLRVATDADSMWRMLRELTQFCRALVRFVVRVPDSVRMTDARRRREVLQTLQIANTVKASYVGDGKESSGEEKQRQKKTILNREDILAAMVLGFRSSEELPEFVLPGSERKTSKPQSEIFQNAYVRAEISKTGSQRVLFEHGGREPTARDTLSTLRFARGSGGGGDGSAQKMVAFLEEAGLSDERESAGGTPIAERARSWIWAMQSACFACQRDRLPNRDELRHLRLADLPAEDFAASVMHYARYASALMMADECAAGMLWFRLEPSDLRSSLLDFWAWRSRTESSEQELAEARAQAEEAREARQQETGEARQEDARQADREERLRKRAMKNERALYSAEPWKRARERSPVTSAVMRTSTAASVTDRVRALTTFNAREALREQFAVEVGAEGSALDVHSMAMIATLSPVVRWFVEHHGARGALFSVRSTLKPKRLRSMNESLAVFFSGSVDEHGVSSRLGEMQQADADKLQLAARDLSNAMAASGLEETRSLLSMYGVPGLGLERRSKPIETISRGWARYWSAESRWKERSRGQGAAKLPPAQRPPFNLHESVAQCYRAERLLAERMAAASRSAPVDLYGAAESLPFLASAPRSGPDPSAPIEPALKPLDAFEDRRERSRVLAQFSAMGERYAAMAERGGPVSVLTALERSAYELDALPSFVDTQPVEVSALGSASDGRVLCPRRLAEVAYAGAKTDVLRSRSYLSAVVMREIAEGTDRARRRFPRYSEDTGVLIATPLRNHYRVGDDQGGAAQMMRVASQVFDFLEKNAVPGVGRHELFRRVMLWMDALAERSYDIAAPKSLLSEAAEGGDLEQAFLIRALWMIGV